MACRATRTRRCARPRPADRKGGHRLFAKGAHPASLDFGDCFAYALAQTCGEPLLYKGADFSLTDVVRHPASG
jgi:uncharacterized protein with PIN domain